MWPRMKGSWALGQDLSDTRISGWLDFGTLDQVVTNGASETRSAEPTLAY